MPEPTVSERRSLSLDGYHSASEPRTHLPPAPHCVRIWAVAWCASFHSGCSSPGAHDAPNRPHSPLAELGAHNDDGFGRSTKTEHA
jgi:hypothetical protein